ncbi:sigma-70 family RNA polymerase sigma factor [Streptomyces sp. NPDC052000]|uniref:sigma-70 family RNA polymerase sigma factor n=1 Tax=Streptomyces sp. NPDC052000 TaxID=3155676 RepID=UPI00344EC2A6
MSTAVADLRRYAPETDLAELQRAHGPALLRFLLRLTLGDRQRAEDLAQETLVRAWQHPEAFEAPYRSMRPWLFTVARRLAIDAHRGRLARPAEVGDEVLLTTAEPGDHTERAAAALDVREAVRTLSSQHRAVLVQLYFRGQSVNEAATALGIAPGTVKSRAYYALRALARVLPGYSSSGPEGLCSTGARSVSASRASSDGVSATSR